MDLNGIVCEMETRPDAHFLVEWIERDAGSLDEAREAIAAYFSALEES